MTKGSDTSLSN